LEIKAREAVAYESETSGNAREDSQFQTKGD
jgi:hypothetical protein